LTELAPAPAPAGSAYEQLSYPGYAYAATHPARLEAVGRLLGLDPAPAATCRVLELGCGDGGNALSIAQSLPGAQVIGVDAAAAAVARGAELARAAGLENVELRVGDFESLSAEELDGVDYVVAHGVYSWIAPAARVALLACVRRCLAPEGIAFVSYNAYPGSYLRDMARDMLRYHLRDVEDPQARLAGAHELMETIVAIEEPSPYARVLREHLERMLRAGDALLFHDDLAEISTPFYLHEIVEHAAAHGLRFLAEAELAESLMRDVPASAERLMAGLPDDAVVREQYLDFFKNRMFRQTLLCHGEAPVRRGLADGVLERLWLSSAARAEEPASADSAEASAAGEGETFSTPDGFTMTTSEPLVLAAMHALAEAWPAAVGFPDLLDRALDAAGRGAPRELVAARLRDVMLQAHLARVVGLHGCPPPVAGGAVGGGVGAGKPPRGSGLEASTRSPVRPRASGLARAQLAAGASVLSSLLHANVRLDEPLDVALLPLLDGTRDRAALCEAAPDGSAGDVDAALGRLAALGLLHVP
jgi:SAM-dependent methyltransferase